MKTMLACASVLAALVASAGAETRYDRKLEEAVKARVAEKIGEIRGTFDHGAGAVFVQPDPIVTGSVATLPMETPETPRQGSLTLAVDRAPSRGIF